MNGRDARSAIRRCLLSLAVVSIFSVGCPPSVPGGGGGGGGQGGATELPDFVDSGDPPFEGDDGTSPQLYEFVYGVQTSVELPSGVDLSLQNLRVVSAAGAATIGSNGSVTPGLPGFNLFLTQVVDSSDRVILYGYTVSAGSPWPINAESTAIALLYFSLGGWTLPDALARNDILIDLRNSYRDILAELTGAIESAMRDDPRAIHNGHSLIRDALAEAKTAILALGTTTTAKRPALRNKTGPSLQSGGSSLLGFVTTDPDRTTPQSGIYLRTSLDSDGITPLNRYRRRAKLYAYLTARETSSGGAEEIDPIRQVEGPVDLLPAGTYSAGDGFIAKAAGSVENWDPTKSELVLLSDEMTGVPGEESSTAWFDIVVLGPALDGPDVPPLLDMPRYEDQRAEWLSAIDELRWKTFLFDFFVPVIDEIGIGGMILQPTSTSAATFAALRALVEPKLTSAGITIRTTAGYGAALDHCLTLFKEDADFRNGYLSIMKRSLGTANAAANYDGIGKNALRALQSMLGGVIEDGSKGPDLGAIYTQLQKSNEADLWRATVSKVTIHPKAPEVTKQLTRTRLSAKVATSEARTYCYRWNSPSAYGYLAEVKGIQSGPDFSSNEDAVFYTSSPNQVSEQELDPVTVTVYDVTDLGGAASDCTEHAGLGNLVGTSTVTVRGRARTDPCEEFDPSSYNRGPITLAVSPSRVWPGDEVTVTVSYDFSQTPVASAQVFLYLPRACGYCLLGDRCMCGPDELAELLYDGTTARYNVGQQELITSVGRNDSEGIPGLGVSCAWELMPTFLLPDPDVPEVITHEFTYVFHRSNFPCLSDSGVCCPFLTRDPFLNTGEEFWSGNFVMAREVGGGADGMAVQILDLGVDTSFEYGVTDECAE